MKKLLLLCALLLVGAAPAGAVSDTFSTGNINAAIGSSLDFGLTVPKSGPVSYVNVAFRISTPDTSQLAVSLVSPKGTEVPLVTNRGAGADFGEGKGCTGMITVFDQDQKRTRSRPARRRSPTTRTRPEGNLCVAERPGREGQVAAPVKNAGAPAHLECLTLYLSRAVPQTYTGAKAGVTAKVSLRRAELPDQQAAAPGHPPRQEGGRRSA